MFPVPEMFAIFAIFAIFDPFIRTPGPRRLDSWMPWPVCPLSSASNHSCRLDELQLAIAGGISSGMQFMKTSVCAGAMV